MAAEFAHPDVLIGLTILAYRYDGLRSADLRSVIAGLKKSLKHEFGPFMYRPTRVRWDEWIDYGTRMVKPTTKPEILPLELLRPNDPDQLQACMDILR